MNLIRMSVINKITSHWYVYLIEPHFVTWYGSHFSYHGACDLVLVSNPSFAFGKGLDIHVRTKHMVNQQFSYVSNAAIRIGDDVLEVVDDGSHFINGVLNSELGTSSLQRTLRKFAKERKATDALL